MKKLILLFIGIISLTLVSCGNNKILNYKNDIKPISLSYDEEIDDITALGTKIDYILFNSFNNNDNKGVKISLGDNLINELKKDKKNVMTKAGYSGVLAHNFLSSYSFSDENNELVIFPSFMEYYGTKDNDKTNDIVSYKLDYYLDILSKKYNFNYKLSDMPLIKTNKDYVLVNNSEELFFVLNEGYIPYAKENSKAYKYLEEAIKILSKIVSLDMSDYEIYKNIFNYVITNNQYDYKTLLDINTQTKENKSFFLEGVFDNGVAVCDGLVKEIVLLSRLMGIEAYHVGAYDGDSGHAYIYVKINDKYYLSCPTRSMNRYPITDEIFKEYYTNNYFLTDLDTNGAGWNYDSLMYLNVKERITETYNYWQNAKYIIDGEEISLEISSKSEAVKLLKYVGDLAKNNKMNLEIELNGSNTLLTEAYNEIKELYKVSRPLNTGTFNSKRLNVYQFEGE